MIALLALCFNNKYPKQRFRNSLYSLKRKSLIKIKKEKNKFSVFF
jgi:hypothetical protein